MKSLYCLLIIFVMSVSVSGCRTSDKAPVAVTDEAISVAPVKVIGANPSKYVPKAVIYKTNGDYNDNVMVNLNSQRTALASYPAPSDVSANSSALPIGDGWLLDRRGGIGPNSVFLRYTYAEYSALKTTPSSSALMGSIIPDAKVTEYRVLPVTAAEAIADPQSLTKYIR